MYCDWHFLDNFCTLFLCQTGYSQIHGTNNTMVMRSYPSSAGRIISNIVQGGRMQLKMRPTPSGFCQRVITKTCLYNIDTLKPHFYIVKLGFTGVYIIFLISAQNIDCWYSLEPPRHIDCWYSLEPPRRGGSNEYQQSMFWAEIWKLSEFFFYLKNYSFQRWNFWIGVVS